MKVGTLEHPHVLVSGSKKGYINKQLFAEYGKILIYHLYAKGQLNKPNFVLMDSHYSHMFNYCYMQMMFSGGVKVFAIEPHASHWGQPLTRTHFLGLRRSSMMSLESSITRQLAELSTSQSSSKCSMWLGRNP